MFRMSLMVRRYIAMKLEPVTAMAPCIVQQHCQLCYQSTHHVRKQHPMDMPPADAWDAAYRYARSLYRQHSIDSRGVGTMKEDIRDADCVARHAIQSAKQCPL